ncbi:glutamine-hydrolyzing GMP synthase [Luteibaculum oceani]|uniref:GMP synthase [glutamine-hydrolyzing] n=1 Tax=Luteibaculum oceani TaxID=1294296 RepID=A0A5C6VE12_9FLAO|nr:glutamine-hydrolyzing GMP synthase [Luteibaculum oceani]TXC81985.1 glutamine-hydrolyzing GMP synthase [Luteibaculum oceani]
MQRSILILDFGSQYTQLIARRVRELNIYCEIHPYNKIPELDENLKGVILSGSPSSVHEPEAPIPNLEGILGKYPVLGICFGAQFLAQHHGGSVVRSEIREYGRANLSSVTQNELTKGLVDGEQVWMSHGDSIKELPDGFSVIAKTKDIPVAAYCKGNIYGLQFHPEVYHTTNGATILRNFCVDICGAQQDYTAASFAEETIDKLKKEVGNEKVILGLSGGVDSSVAAVLLHKAIGENLHCIFVDNGLLRKNEFEEVLEAYKGMGLNVRGVNASQQFYDALKGIKDPEQKRKNIGKVFIDVFDAEAKKVEGATFLAQGTIYPDVIESVSVNGPSATIKSHHNVGGLPDFMKLKIVEPLRLLFKDEVRRVGKTLGISDKIIGRHPFPGPGLAIRILGDITPEKVAMLQEADAIYINGLKEAGLYDQVWQAGAILLPVQSVGVMGDERTYENCVALRAVTSTDGMTADWCHLPYEFLGEISNKIINRVKGINRVVYDISSKPPATIEWE